MSTRARELVHEADEELLRRLAEEHGPARAPRTVHRRLSSGVGVSITVQPVDQPRGEYAAVLVLAPQPDASGTTVAPPGDAAAEEPGLAVQLDRALATRRPVLVIGERGTGKRHTARAALRGTVVEVDAALAGPDPEGWLRELLAAVRDERATVLLTHLSELPGRLAGQVADLVGGAPGRVVGTASADTGPDAAALLVREAFPVVLTVPPVRERRAEFAALCRSLLEELGAEDGRPSVLTTRALAALSAGDWPGNVRQLLQVLATARIRVAGTTIDVADLPPSSRGASPGRTLGELERIERQALAAALREAGGNRRTAAERLGISRATVYRKIKRYELH